MKKIIILLIASLLITGCSQKEKESTTTKEKTIKIVSISEKEVKKITDNYEDYPNIDIIDVRTSDEFAENHIKGAINIPMEHLNEIIISNERELIIYANDTKTAKEAYEELYKLGYENIKCLGSIDDYSYELENSD